MSKLLGVGTGNLAYLVTVGGEDRRYVFRFNRGFREDVYGDLDQVAECADVIARDHLIWMLTLGSEILGQG